MRKMSFIVIVFLLGLNTLANAGDIDWEQIGSTRPRHTREIQLSNWTIGAETMDRDYALYKNWKDYLGPLGVKKRCIQGGWAKTEKQTGIYDFTWLDEVIFEIPKSAYSTKGNKYTFISIPCYDSPVLKAERTNLHMNE